MLLKVKMREVAIEIIGRNLWQIPKRKKPKKNLGL